MKQTTKFLHIVMCMVLGLSVSMSSCKDYDEDIDSLQQQIDENKTAIADLEKAIESGKWVSSYEATETGYTLTLSDGTKLTITNGKDGAQGAQGETGLTGPEGPVGPEGPQGEPGEAGATIIPQFGVDAEGYWQYSVDEGKTWVAVTDQEGNKIKAQGPQGPQGEQGEQGPAGEEGVAGGNNVIFNEDGYIQIGDVVTDLKANGNRPVMVADMENGTLALTWEDKTYVLLMAGSEYDGLQSLVYRRMAADDTQDKNYAFELYYRNTATQEDETIASVPGKVQFKVLPREFDVEKASYAFFDTHLTKAAEEPSIAYVDGSAKLENGILTVAFVPENLETTENYASTLEVTLNGKVTTSDYFNVNASKLNVNSAVVYVQSDDDRVAPNQVAQMTGNFMTDRYHYEFVYTASYNLNDSIAFGFMPTGFEEYQSFEELGVGEYLKTTYELTEEKNNGLFELSADGVITVKDENQGSAINEYCYVTVTYEVVNAEGNVVREVARDLAIQAVRATTTYGNVEILALNDGDLSMAYDAEKAQVVALDVRKFEDQVGGRNVLNPNNSKSNSKVWRLGFYNEDEELEAVPATLPYVGYAPNSNTFTLNEGEMFLYFKAGDNTVTSQDSLFLIVGPKTYFENVVARDYYAVEYKSGQLDKAVVGTKNFFLNLGIDKTIKVTRYEALVDANGYAKVRGLWDANKDFTMSANLTNYYKVTPSDVKLHFVLAPEEEQPAAVQKVYNLLSITEDAATGAYMFLAEPTKDQPIDVNAVKDIKVYAYNADEYGNPNAKPLVSDLKLQLVSPLNDIKTTASPKDPVKIKDNGGQDIELKMKDIMSPSLTDKYELYSDPKATNQTVVEKGEVKAEFNLENDVITYGVRELVYSIANMAEVEAAMGEGTVDINPTSGVLTIKDTRTAFAKTTIKINVTCKHSWGSSTAVPTFEYTIYRD